MNCEFLFVLTENFGPAAAGSAGPVPTPLTIVLRFSIGCVYLAGHQLGDLQISSWTELTVKDSEFFVFSIYLASNS